MTFMDADALNDRDRDEALHLAAGDAVRVAQVRDGVADWDTATTIQVGGVSS